MEFTGQVMGVSKDWNTNKFQITFSVNEDRAITTGYDSLKDLDKITVKVAKYRKKRSLDANAYAWLLMSKIAGALGTSKEEVYEIMLKRYGKLYEDEDGLILITVKESVDRSKIDGHWQKIKDNGKYVGYAMIKGSSEYDTKEMSTFIDGVVSEAKELEIETISLDELANIKEKWGVEVAQKDKTTNI